MHKLLTRKNVYYHSIESTHNAVCLKRVRCCNLPQCHDKHEDISNLCMIICDVAEYILFINSLYFALL